MEFKRLLGRRSHEGVTHEPYMLYAYRVLGVAGVVTSALGSLASYLIGPAATVLPLPGWIGVGFGMALFFTGLAASETWLYFASLRSGNPANRPYSRNHLGLAVFGFSASVVVIILVILYL